MDNSTGINILDKKLSYQTQLKLDSLYHHNARSRQSPQLIIFIIDMSEQMQTPYREHKTKMKYSSHLIQTILKEIFTGYHIDICKDCFISLLGYSRGMNEEPDIIKSDWIQDWEYEICANGLDSLLTSEQGKVSCSTKGAFLSITDMCKEWIKTYPPINKYNKEGYLYECGSPTPIIIHITSGDKMDFNMFEEEIKGIHSIRTVDGMPLLFNILLKNDEENEIFCPEHYKSNVDSNQNLFEVSSFCPHSFCETMERYGANRPSEKIGRLFCVNPYETDKIKELVRCMTQHYDFMFGMYMNPYVGDVQRVGEYDYSQFPYVVE